MADWEAGSPPPRPLLEMVGSRGSFSPRASQGKSLYSKRIIVAPFDIVCLHSHQRNRQCNASSRPGSDAMTRPRKPTLDRVAKD